VSLPLFLTFDSLPMQVHSSNFPYYKEGGHNVLVQHKGGSYWGRFYQLKGGALHCQHKREGYGTVATNLKEKT